MIVDKSSGKMARVGRFDGDYIPASSFDEDSFSMMNPDILGRQQFQQHMDSYRDQQGCEFSHVFSPEELPASHPVQIVLDKGYHECVRNDAEPTDCKRVRALPRFVLDFDCDPACNKTPRFRFGAEQTLYSGRDNGHYNCGTESTKFGRADIMQLVTMLKCGGNT